MLFTSLFILTDCFIVCLLVMRVPGLLLTLISALLTAPWLIVILEFSFKGNGPLFMVDFSLALLLMVDLLFTLLSGLFVTWILLLLCTAWFIEDVTSDELLPDRDAASYPLQYAS